MLMLRTFLVACFIFIFLLLFSATHIHAYIHTHTYVLQHTTTSIKRVKQERLELLMVRASVSETLTRGPQAVA
uniref:Putative secreted protein n=1 Tax=Anopheles darlingi TaxID=43151 RepID=A0A2M4D4D2_ANODA